MSKEQNKDDAEVVVSTIALHPDHDKKIRYECTRGMCERVIDKVLADSELMKQIKAHRLDAIERVKRGERDSVQRPYNSEFIAYIEEACGKDRMDVLWMDVMNYVERELIVRKLIVLNLNDEGRS